MTDKTENIVQMFHPIKNISFKGCTLILPSVSVGNVGQLCIDLLIHSLDCEKAGYLWHPAILPVVGADPYKVSSPDLSLPAEVYYSKDHKLVVLQLRSSIIKNLRKAFLSEIVNWTNSNGIAQIIVLTGSSNEERIDAQITSEPFRYLVSSEPSSKLDDLFRSLGWIGLERREHFPALSKVESLEKGSEKSGQIVIPGGGFAKRLFEVCSENGLQCATLIKFCSEGDNISDALFMLEKLNRWLKVIKTSAGCEMRIVFPPSWSHVYGSPAPRVLY